MIDDGDASARLARLEGAAAVIEGLGGAYITAEDIGTTTADMDHMSRFTRFCVGRSVGNGGRGDPSPVTAETVLAALRRGIAAQTGSDELDGRRVGVIGLGKVGGALAAGLASAGAEVLGCDIDPARCERLAAEHGISIAPSAEALLGAKLDVLAPCAARRADRRRPGALARRARGRGRGQQPARPPRRRRHPGGARHPLRARLPGQLRRADPRRLRVVGRRPGRRARPHRARHGQARRRDRHGGDRGRHAGRGRRAAGARAGRGGAGARWRCDDRLDMRSFEPVSTRRTFEEAVEQIAEQIKGGELHTGDRLPSERDLAAQMRISRPTLREAIKTLDGGGRAAGAPRPVGRHLRGLGAGAARAAAQPPGDPLRRDRRACSRRAGCSSRGWRSWPPCTPRRRTSW